MQSPELEKSEKDQIKGADKRTVKTSGNYEVCEHMVQDTLSDHTIVKIRKSESPFKTGSMTKKKMYLAGAMSHRSLANSKKDLAPD